LERRPGLQVPELLIETSANIVEKAESVRMIAVRRRVLSCPLRLGGSPFLLYAKEREIYRRAALFSYVWRHGEQCHGVDGRPGESCSSRGVAARLVPEQERLRGWWCGGWPFDRRPLTGLRGLSMGARTRYSGRYGDVLPPCPQQRRECRCSMRRGAAVTGMAAQD
jgi:hypothetical protein